MRRDDSGATSVEFALVVPLFFLLIAIPAYFAWQVFTASQLERAAQRAARYAAVPTTEGGYAYAHCDVVAEVNRGLSSVTLDAASVEVRDARGALAKPASCPGGDPAVTPHGYVRVHVQRELDNPFADLVTFLMGRNSAMTISGSGEARVEDPT